jgi:branched-chain amino acid transport system permease protein
MVCFVLGAISEQILKYLYGKTIEYTLIVTYAILIIGIDVIKTIWGVDYKAVKPPEGMSWLIPLLEVDFYRLFVVMVGITLYLLTVLFLRYIMLGKIVTEFIDNDKLLQAIGVNPRITTIIMYALGLGRPKLSIMNSSIQQGLKIDIKADMEREIVGVNLLEVALE